WGDGEIGDMGEIGEIGEGLIAVAIKVEVFAGLKVADRKAWLLALTLGLLLGAMTTSDNKRGSDQEGGNGQFG
ncbi:MAG: hypothetical protein ACTS3T_13815, partial [Almyronema sp.]